MNAQLKGLPLQERLQLVEDLWDSIAAEQAAVQLTPAQREELDRRLDAYAADSKPGRQADTVVADIRRTL